jgi:hypothetical protein
MWRRSLLQVSLALAFSSSLIAQDVTVSGRVNVIHRAKADHISADVVVSLTSNLPVPFVTRLVCGMSQAPLRILGESGWLRRSNPTVLLTPDGLLIRDSESFGPRFRGSGPTSMVGSDPRSASLETERATHPSLVGANPCEKGKKS